MKNLFDIDTTAISDVNLLMTMMYGKFTYDLSKEMAKKEVVKIEVTNPALRNVIDIDQLNLLVTDELEGAFHPWRGDGEEDHAYDRNDNALLFVSEDAKAVFNELPGQGYTFARPARAIHWEKDGQNYWIQWTLKDDAAVLRAYDPEANKAVENFTSKR